MKVVFMIISGVSLQFCSCLTLPGLTGGTVDKAITGSVFLTFRTSSVQHCTRLCLYSSACASVNWMSTTSECQLNSQEEAAGGLEDSPLNIYIPMRRMQQQMSPCNACPCPTRLMCVPVIKSTSHRCVALGHNIYPPSTSERPTLSSGATPATTAQLPTGVKEKQTTTTGQTTPTTEEVTATSDQATATKELTDTSGEATVTTDDLMVNSDQATAATEGVTATSGQVTAITEDLTATSDQTKANTKGLMTTAGQTIVTVEDLTATSDQTKATTEGLMTTPGQTIVTVEDLTATSDQVTGTTQNLTPTSDQVTAAIITTAPTQTAACVHDSDCNLYPNTSCSGGQCTCPIGYDLDLVRDVCRSLQECSIFGSNFIVYRSKFIHQNNVESIKPSTESKCSQVCLTAKYTCKNFDMIQGGCYTQDVSWLEVSESQRRSPSYYDADHYQRKCDW
ncbi:uncharacterized protein [Haliotis asinina]|uniref:uncharacterized protein n=1 Tax=Haliotis asinina TaxID=109174 RepID=UPI003531808C